MPDISRGRRWIVVVITAAVLVAAGTAAFLWRAKTKSQPQALLPSTAPTTTPTTSPVPIVTTRPKVAGPTTSYVDVVRKTYSSLEQVEPLVVPVNLSQAARIVLRDYIYLSPPPRTDLWITRKDAPETEKVLRAAMDPEMDVQTHVLRERVEFVHWLPMEDGRWVPYLITPSRSGGYELVSPSQRRTIDAKRKYRWDRALSWNDQVVVPTDSGISIFTFEPKISESHYQLTDAAKPSDASEPQFLFDWRGVLAWSPWERGKTGSRGAARFVDGKWVALDATQGWPEKLLHIVPLLDGSVLQVINEGGDSVRFALTILDEADIDEKQIAALVEQLSDVDADVRHKAFDELSQYGPGVWRMLEEMANDQPPEGQTWIRHLLKSKVQPTLGGMSLVDDRMQVITRLSDGGVVFYSSRGVSIPQEKQDEAVVRSPAWISIRPGQTIELLHEMMVRDLDPKHSRIMNVDGEWIVDSNADGPRWFVGNGFETLLLKTELDFRVPVGVDRRRRWLFRHATASIATSAPHSAPTSHPDAQTLILDPTLPDPTPRLPVWIYTTAESVGWDAKDWPVVKRGGAPALHEDGWEPLPKKNRMFTDPRDIRKIVPATTSSTRPATTRAVELGEPLLISRNGSSYYDGLDTLHVITANGEEVIWPLPAMATGRGPVSLVESKEGLLFLFNERGRVLRIRPSPDGKEPFRLEGTFTEKIPSVEKPTRIWLDPANRIIMAYGSRLAIMFPQGYVPASILNMMDEK